MKTFVFPGQGSQAMGMGGELFDEYQSLIEKADEILGYSVKALCLEDPDEVLGQTQYTQVALYVVNALSYYKAMDEEGAEKPDFVAGHSLGEFNALLAAEVFSFETGLKLVKKRGELMSQATGGGMVAIVNSTEEVIKATLKEQGLNNIEIANYNTPTQIVLSGEQAQIEQSEAFLKVDKVRFLPLKTSGAFHSSLMQPAADQFGEFLGNFTFDKPTIPVFSNVTAKLYEDGAIASGLTSQMTSSVRWTETMQYLLAQPDMSIVEIGNGKVLSKLVKGIQKYNKTMAANG